MTLRVSGVKGEANGGGCCLRKLAAECAYDHFFQAQSNVEVCD